MLLRRQAEGVIAITQPAHAGVAGQLAAAWGNDGFARPRAFEDWCLAVAIHDIGWCAWEQSPVRDVASGWPQEFPQVSPLVHVELWRAGVARAALFGRLPALLVSRHADTIYSRHTDRAALPPPVAAAVTRFLDEQHALQEALAASLAADPSRRDAATPDAIEQGRLALATLDELSLALLWGVRGPRTLAEVPRGDGRLVDLVLRPGAAPGEAVLAPWPFACDRLTVTCDGRLLAAPSASDAALAEALDRAPYATVSARLHPG